MTDIDPKDLPDWAKQMACDEANAQGPLKIWRPEEVGGKYSTLNALALRIYRTEKEPVDPDLEAAREFVAKRCEADGLSHVARSYRAGKGDEWDSVKHTLKAIKLGRELAKAGEA